MKTNKFRISPDKALHISILHCDNFNKINNENAKNYSLRRSEIRQLPNSPKSFTNRTNITGKWEKRATNLNDRKNSLGIRCFFVPTLAITTKMITEMTKRRIKFRKFQCNRKENKYFCNFSGRHGEREIIYTRKIIRYFFQFSIISPILLRRGNLRGYNFCTRNVFVDFCGEWRRQWKWKAIKFMSCHESKISAKYWNRFFLLRNWKVSQAQHESEHNEATNEHSLHLR